MTVGVVGLGIIGSVWARHYHAAGRLVGAWNRTAKPDFPGWKKTLEEVAAVADVTQVVVADPPAVRSVLERMAPALGPSKIVVQSSTIDPQSSDEFRRLVTGRGARYLEAPFTGSKPAAEQRRTIFYLGGEAALCAELEPLLAFISETRFRIGDHKQAAALKLAMNLNIAAQMQALAEALTFARRAGVKDEVFFAALAKNASYSGLTKLKESKLRAGNFSPQFSVKHMHKDMRLAAAAAKPGGPTGDHALPLLETVRERLRLAEERGWGDEDFSALLKLL